MRVLWCRRREGGGGFGRESAIGGVHAARADDGFTIVETMVALGVIFTVLVGMLASFDTGIRGVVTGRQRTGATALAKEIIERARAADYDLIGHDVAGDSTLTTDPRITGTSPKYFQPEGIAAPEPLAIAEPATDALFGGSDPTQSYAAHEWTETHDGSTYTAQVYVTTVDPAAGDDHKRLTVAVSWGNPQYDPNVVANEVWVSTLVYRFGTATARTSGVVDVDTGTVTVTGTLAGINLTRGVLYFPFVHADVAGDLVAEAHGYAGASRSELVVGSGSASGCGTSGSTARCDGVKADTVADDDGGTDGIGLQDSEGPLSYAGGTLSAGLPLSLSLGSTAGTVLSQSAAESCTTCVPSVGDGDGRLYGTDTAGGPNAMSAGFDSGLVSGSLFSIASAGSSTATIDADPVAADQKVVSTGRQVVPAVGLVSLSLAPLGFTSAVSVGAVDVTATAAAGPTAGAPIVTGNAVSIQVYDTGLLGLPAYRTITVTPGLALESIASVGFTVGGGLLPLTQVTLDTTVRSAAKSVNSTSSGGVITSAEANAANWLVISVRLRIVELGISVADLTVELDYGRLVAQAGYTQA